MITLKCVGRCWLATGVSWLRSVTTRAMWMIMRHSVTKSVMATLVGAALRDGRLPSIDAKLGDLLPQHRSIMDSRTGRVTVRQLLSQTAGYSRDRFATSILIARQFLSC